LADYDTSGVNGTNVTIRLMVLADGVPDAALRAWNTIRIAEPIAADPVAAIRSALPDLLVLAADRVTPELAALLTEPSFAALPVILLAGADDAEAAGLLLDRPISILEAPVDPVVLTAAVGLEASHLGRASVADAGTRYEPDSRLAALKRDADRVAAALGEMAGTRAADTVRVVTSGRIRAHIKARRQRARFFDAALFADPVWDIMLDLAASRLEERPVSVSSLCIAAHVPTTTALRTIKQMVDRGLLTRASDPSDARRSFIRLTAPTAEAMEGCLEAVLNQPGL
jgi:DNA-binding MarR family transcriptional regulator